MIMFNGVMVQEGIGLLFAGGFREAGQRHFLCDGGESGFVFLLLGLFVFHSFRMGLCGAK
jgi:hypothetical protein